MVKHTQTIGQQQPTNYLSVFDPLVGLALKRLKVRPIHFYIVAPELFEQSNEMISGLILMAALSLLYYFIHKTYY